MPNVNSEIWWLAGWGSGSSPDLSDSGSGTLTFGTSGAEAFTDRGAAGLSLSVDGREVRVETGVGTLVLTPTGTFEVTGEPTPAPPRHVLTPSGPVDVGPEYIYVPARPQPPRRVVTRQSVRVPAAPRRVKVIVAPARTGTARRRDEDELLLMGLL